MQFGDLATEGEADTGAFDAGGDGFVDAVKLLKNPALMGPGNTRPAITCLLYTSDAADE